MNTNDDALFLVSFFFHFIEDTILSSIKVVFEKKEKKRGKKIRATQKSSLKQKTNFARHNTTLHVKDHHVLLRRLALAERRARERLGAAIDRRFSFPNARFDVRVAVFDARFRKRVF